MFGLVGIEHTWEMFSGEYMSFLSFLVGFLEKRDEISKFGQFRGLTLRRRDPT